jgi:hypothetical protein
VMQEKVIWGGVLATAFSLVAGCGLWCLWNGLRSRRWPTASGVILRSDIDGFGDVDGSPSYRLRVAYRYEVAGRQFVGKRVFFGQGVLNTGSFDRLLRKTNRYGPGVPVNVYFHPKRPSLCVLQPGMRLEAWIVTIVGLGLLGWLGSGFL